MNQLLDSPIESLAFNYVSFGIFTVGNNLWTWIAVVTAALSFWKIRAAAGAVVSSGYVQSNDPKPSTSISDESPPVPEPDSEQPTPSSSVVDTSVSPLVCRGEVVTRGKFKLTVYFDDDGEESDVDVDDGGVRVTGRSDGGGGDCNEWWESWEGVLKLRNGETGWYRHQDLSALNGNVVRLWDESCKCRTKAQAVVL
ncbi:Plant invertase/pectin methylesterase inhibitor superfamily protein [Hibiscus syriacus]|uniref:Plant invertase/pectin methylesterase inhibitor superfamily protein n=1 Tax=Hibiscus syriacus TaxID=106335 RepID=A0A6A3D3R9_HIBSY|nr:uncharacterized protein LOC120193103 [Hibiscus syriacus]KAE8735287.1 Plant invertase/pectin methylesterase inhibitor superfamily protein [Hibiscus syriacus]